MKPSSIKVKQTPINKGVLKSFSLNTRENTHASEV